jgi:hypothetical protein
MSTENTQNTDDLNLEQYETQNRQLIDAIIEAEDGVCKNASTAASVMIRRRIRENGFTRKIIPPKQIGNEDLTRLQDSELPAIVEDMEGDQATAKTISFNDTPDTEFYRGERFTVVFNKVSSPIWSKNLDELRTYRMDLRRVVSDNALKDIQTEEDFTFIFTSDEIVGSAGGVGAAGVQQHFQINGDITRATYVPILNHLTDRYLNNGVWLLNRGWTIAEKTRPSPMDSSIQRRIFSASPFLQ